MTEIEFRSLEDIEWRVDEGDDGTFAGYACRYGKKDSYGTTFHPGVFRKGLDKSSYALLFMHSPYQPVGTFRAEERSDHLWIEGRYDDTAAGRDARVMARSGSARELSVGFVRTDLPDWKKLYEMEEDARKDALENIRSARLVEVSQITARMAAVPGSKLKTVRSALGDLYEAADEPSLADRLRQFDEERAQREAEEQEKRMGERARRAAWLKLTTVGGA
ncbi:MAG TPA: HK97 family phage prohead protease [Streptomyces sp.]|nr:HK97 family phage prohead protease [Streptomyces sp.]